MQGKAARRILVLSLLISSLAACSGISSTTAPRDAGAERTLSPGVNLTDALLTIDYCINHTRNTARCIDCCDGLDADGARRRACRFACKQHNFSRNTDFIDVELPEILGADGDYTACTAAGLQGKCTLCCDETSQLASGDRKHCRQACDRLPDQRDPSGSSTEVGSNLETLPGVYVFTEGPAVDPQGNLFFSDIPAGRIYRWFPDGHVAVFRESLDRPNGLAFTRDGALIACEGGAGRLISIDSQGQVTALADRYNGKRFNEPNDLWIDPHGGIYFSDPAYQSPLVQDGEHVYYLAPEYNRVVRVITDMVRPNGIVGTPGGETLYVTDHGAGRTYAYDINPDGTLANRRLFVPIGSDGMALDEQGNLYLTTGYAVLVFDAAGNLVERIAVPKRPSNVTFGGAGGKTLFITARSAVYILPIDAHNAPAPANPP